MKIFSGRSNNILANEIAKNLNVKIGKSTFRQFADGELWFKYEENIRGQDVFVIQSTHPPAENILELVLMIDAAVRASADRVTAVIPYYGYARQDRKDQPRVPISARSMMDILASVGASRVLAMDLHSAQIQGFTHLPFDHLYARKIILKHLKKLQPNSKDTVILAPDVGRAPMAQSYAKHLGVGFALIDKRRIEPNKAKVLHMIGNLESKKVIILDDMIDTAGSMINAAETAMENGAKSVVSVATHGLFSDDAIDQIMKSSIEKVIVANTVQLSEKKYFEKLEIISVAPLFANAIANIHSGESVSALFNV
tara:strand:+ start:17962 stop:18894 length:933 start_codon:yes stop_codon:yes gene_type:complete